MMTGSLIFLIRYAHCFCGDDYGIMVDAEREKVDGVVYFSQTNIIVFSRAIGLID